MKRSVLFISALIAVLCFGIISEADARRWKRYPRGHAYGYYRHHPRAWVAPPPVVVVPRYHYRGHPRYYRAAPRYNGYYRSYYGYNRPYYRRW